MKNGGKKGTMAVKRNENGGKKNEKWRFKVVILWNQLI